MKTSTVIIPNSIDMISLKAFANKNNYNVRLSPNGSFLLEEKPANIISLVQNNMNTTFTAAVS